MIVDCALYEDGRRRPGELALDELSAACHARNAFVWIGLYEPTEEEFDAVAREFELHELAVEDAIKAHQRPKLEVYDNMVFVVYKTARYIEENETVEFGEVQTFVGHDYVIVVRHGEGPVRSLPPVAHSNTGPSSCTTARPRSPTPIADRVVDDYTPVIQGSTTTSARSSSRCSRGGLRPRRAHLQAQARGARAGRCTAPLAEPLGRPSQAATGSFPRISSSTTATSKTISCARSSRSELPRPAHERPRGQPHPGAVRQNEDMRKISAWVAIAAVPTMIAGIYGMNFENMPELELDYGYPVVLGLIAAACLTLYFYFRRSGWL